MKSAPDSGGCAFMIGVMAVGIALVFTIGVWSNLAR